MKIVRIVFVQNWSWKTVSGVRVRLDGIHWITEPIYSLWNLSNVHLCANAYTNKTHTHIYTVYSYAVSFPISHVVHYTRCRFIDRNRYNWKTKIIQKGNIHAENYTKWTHTHTLPVRHSRTCVSSTHLSHRDCTHLINN